MTVIRCTLLGNLLQLQNYVLIYDFISTTLIGLEMSLPGFLYHTPLPLQEYSLSSRISSLIEVDTFSIVSSLEDQALKMFNMTSPESFENQTANQTWIPTEEDNIQIAVSMTALWIGIVLGVYIILHLIKYLQNKPPALQSQLDIMYEITFQSWILNGCMSILTFTLPFLFGVPWALAVIIGWSRIFIHAVALSSMILGGVFRLVLIFKQDQVEGLSDSTLKISLW